VSVIKLLIRNCQGNSLLRKIESSTGLSLSILSNYRQIGSTFVGLGFIFSLLGMMLFFEANLLRLGNMLIIIGLPLFVGPIAFKNYFLKKSRLQATIIISIGDINNFLHQTNHSFIHFFCQEYYWCSLEALGWEYYVNYLGC
jgi:hypothetical protein